MSYALHRGYEQASTDPASDFAREAHAALHLEQLVEAFARVIAPHGGTGHYCSAIDEDGAWLPFFGDTPALAAAGADGDAEIIAVQSLDGEPLVMSIALSTPADRQRLSTFRMLSTLYAIHAVTLLEADDEIPGEGQITPTEQQCFSLMLAGWSHLDIGEQLDRSATAVGVHMRRAAERLGASSVTEAAAIIMSRGLVSQQLPIGTTP